MRRGRRLGEGCVIAVALTLLLALCFGLWLHRRPRAQLAAPVHRASVKALQRAERIDLNAAPAGRLEELPGIGPALAAAIVEYREAHGPFGSVEELDAVPGIGPVKIEAARPYIRLE